MRRKRKTIITDLTPLLDVIFIILFVILMRSRVFRDNVIKEVGDELDSAKTELAKANEKIADYDIAFQDSKFISVSIERVGGERTLVIRDGDRYLNYDYDWNKYSAFKEEFRSIMEDHCKQKGDKPLFITFVYESNNTFNRDYQSVMTILESLQNKYDDVYVQARDSAGSGKESLEITD